MQKEEFLTILEDLGFSLQPCMNFGYHYFINGRGKVQAYFGEGLLMCSVGARVGDPLEWEWKETNNPEELKEYAKQYIQIKTKEAE